MDNRRHPSVQAQSIGSLYSSSAPTGFSFAATSAAHAPAKSQNHLEGLVEVVIRRCIETVYFGLLIVRLLRAACSAATCIGCFISVIM